MTKSPTPKTESLTPSPSSNGHLVSGNGHPVSTNGHAANGNGHASNGQATNGQATNGQPAAAPRVRPAGIALFDKVKAYDIPAKIKAAGVWTYFRALESAQDPEVYIDGKKLVMLGSNNYLGLTNDPRVKEAAIDAVRRYGTGCAGSRLLNGTMKIHEELEEKLADFMGKQAAVTFSTGFQVNLGTISCLLDRRDIVYLDKQDHACIIDGARLGLGEIRKFRHNSPADLRRMMQADEASDAGKGGGKLVVVDGVYSMEGDICPLPEIVDICKDYGAAVMVDDAHGIGVLGDGRGTSRHFGVDDDVQLIMGTFSKSMASVGGFVCGDRETMDFVKHRARTNMFSAAPSPANVAAASIAVDIMKTEPERREKLWKNTQFMLAGFRALGFDTADSNTPVIPVVVGEDFTAFAMATRLHQEGVFVNAVVSPATPPGRALLRTSYMATHEESHLSFALDKFAKVGREFGVIA
ncbi:pyridoxal phosphate-dependent aminotransferase family protein [Humisphaera borealis]|uniref:Pyridoxal phosphate-dependent aminotransferase family protein n=2 Tax=Humisphaera borealis TaxID=2807512 RepID=A0A7M2WXG5_9BACT|nr:pyridoxal phosphate-dependent aminotransferase family protein [Humisphaera borealis]QOV90217.1 pyridoxal phosphate-dependent aminotransferase family protein [Humisphaera borealis]